VLVGRVSRETHLTDSVRNPRAEACDTYHDLVMPEGKPVRTLKRPIQPVPDIVRGAVTARDIMGAYDARPPYQRNDYINWITRAKRPETQQKRIEIMLRELFRRRDAPPPRFVPRAVRLAR
jgi:hypothetical protein